MTMSEFLFLYRGAQRPGSPEEMQRMTQKWVDWITGLAQQGNLKDRGQPLQATGKVVAGANRTVTDGPYAETKDIVGGYSVIQARDLDHAVELSHDCPAFEVGGSVEIRPVTPMTM
jgi:hypothetical protein